MPSGNCFHCGLTNPPNPPALNHESEHYEFCCLGCKSAAVVIFDSGLGDYYRFHKPDQQPVEVSLSEQQSLKFSAFDDPDFQSTFVDEKENHQHSAILIVEGMTCSACAWLIEKRLLQLPGVLKATVNASTHRLLIDWQNHTVKLSDIIKALFLLGYRASPFVADEQERVRHKTHRQFIFRLGIAAIGMMQTMMTTVALYSGHIDPSHERLLWWTGLFLTVPVLLISALPFFKNALANLTHRQVSMDVSISVALLSAFIASAFATFTGLGEVYYESVNMFTFFLVLSRFLEFRARSSAHLQGNKLAGLLPQTCLKLTNGETELVGISRLNAGDTIILMPGDIAPIDGIVTCGQSEFDESSFTGEFKGVVKTKGDFILAGTINLHQRIEVTVSKKHKNSTYEQLNKLVEKAGLEKPKLAMIADKGARQFVWSTLAISLIIGLVWLLYDPSRAFWVVISVLVVTCPCALSLATPTAFAQATANLRQKGFVITRGYALERLAALHHIAFDKTGTLTEGQFSVHNVQCTDEAKRRRLTDQDILTLCAKLEDGNKHPIATAFKPHKQSSTHAFSHLEGHIGYGVSGYLNNERWVLCSSFQSTIDSSLTESGHGTTCLDLKVNDTKVATIELADQLREHLNRLFPSLNDQQITAHVLTGDSSIAMEPMLREYGLTGDFKHACKPEDKVAWLSQQKSEHIAVVGDGVNDAPLLAKAGLSIAMMDATDLTRAQADILLLTNNLSVLGEAVKTAKRTQQIIRQNLAWALIYNAVALPIAALGWVSPWQAAIGMSLSSLLVVGNSLRLRH